MTKILHIVASPRGEESQSSKLAKAYLKSAAKMTFFGVGEMSGVEQTAWDHVVEITSRFTKADLYVISVPMWNGGIPYKFKQYIDIITQPGLLFGFDPEAGYSGLLEGKKAVVFYTSGVWAPGAPKKYGSDFHSEYLGWWLDFVGVKDVETVRFQPSLLTPDPEAGKTHAINQAIGLIREEA